MKKPNIVLLFPDQARYDSLGAAGFPWIKTPHLDRLVKEGCLFTRAYTPNPLCMPARYSLLTGRSPDAHGFFGIRGEPIDDRGLPTLPQILSDKGWATAAVGKMHFHPPRRHHGFEWMRLMEEIPRDRSEDDYAVFLKSQGAGDIQNLHGIRPLLYHEPQGSLVPENLHGESWVDREAVAWMNTVKHRPFFLMCGWIKPHPPWNLPPKWKNHYSDAELPEPIPLSRSFPFPSAPSPFYGDTDSPEEKRRIREAYYASVSQVDDSVGRVISWLENENLLENTIVIYASDHGEMLQDKGFYQKTLPYESSVHIPLVIRWPKNFKPGSRDDRLADLMDLFPTLLDLTGVDDAQGEYSKSLHLEGRSLAKTDKGTKTHQHFSCVTGSARWSAVRDERYKYVYFYNGGAEQLFDLQKDPRELNDLCASGNADPLVLEPLRRRVMVYESEHGPPGAVQNGRPVAFPGHEIDPATDNNASCKYPFWAHGHFQTFGESEKRESAFRFVEEVRLALGTSHPSERLRKICPGENWKKSFKEKLSQFGDEDGNIFRELFPFEPAVLPPDLRE